MFKKMDVRETNRDVFKGEKLAILNLDVCNELEKYISGIAAHIFI